MGIEKVFNKRTGQTYVYETVRELNPLTGRMKTVRKPLGKLDENGNLIPTNPRPSQADSPAEVSEKPESVNDGQATGADAVTEPEPVPESASPSGTSTPEPASPEEKNAPEAVLPPPDVREMLKSIVELSEKTDALFRSLQNSLEEMKQIEELIRDVEKLAQQNEES